ncbi:MAG TPA: NADPH:quinone oxidoreductase family protein [Roseiarcus sp.]|nr:NADPH:quinone oxidoreductase family protein [Roseiarcus sp.]
MKALICDDYGPPEKLKIIDAPEPTPGKGEALIEVGFAGLNFFDLLVIENKYQAKPPLPFSPAAEFSGRILALGPGATGFKPGDRVLGYFGFGCARERLVCPVDRLAPIPPGLSDEKAAGLTITYGTTLHALKQRADLKAGETLVVLGASGGVGLAAVELGARFGARVIACASSDEKLKLVRRMGAAETVNYATSDLRAELKRLSDGRGVDVVYDPVGGALTEQALRSLAWKGRLLVIGFASGEIPKPPLNLVLLKGCDIRGVYWGEFLAREPAAHRANMAQLLEDAASGAISAHVHGVYPLKDYREAFAAIARREAVGKVILKLAGNG